MALPVIGEVMTSRVYTTCVACGVRYRPKWMLTLGGTVGVSDHVCNSRRLARREKQLRREFDDGPRYCECDDLDCKYEYLDYLRNDME